LRADRRIQDHRHGIRQRNRRLAPSPRGGFRHSGGAAKANRMNILITGASRGIGAAAYALLRKTGHKVVGHSTKGSDTLIAGDLTDAAAPRDIWDTALDELAGE